MKLREGVTLTKLQQYRNRIRGGLHGEVIVSLSRVFPIGTIYVDIA